MAGIYLHIPFCRSACAYCNFHFSTSIKNKKHLIEAMQKEILIRKDYLNNETIGSIYFGGGTPSFLEINEINDLLETINKNFKIDSDSEITIEANPEDLNKNYLSELKSSGINRLSIGIQSFFEEDLKTLGRKHNYLQAEKCIDEAREAEFTNLSIDLIYGIPDSNLWKKNLEKLSNYNIPHFSAYSLTLEPKTIYHWQVNQQKAKAPDEQYCNLCYTQLCDFASKNNYIHYEISNFGKNGFESKHNSAYWNNKNYLGIGPSAHSYNGSSRQWNISINNLYISKIINNEAFYEIENLSRKDKINEYLLTHLRTKSGIKINEIKNLMTQKEYQSFLVTSEKIVKKGFAQINNDIFVLTEEAFYFSDGIISSLFTD